MSRDTSTPLHALSTSDALLHLARLVTSVRDEKIALQQALSTCQHAIAELRVENRKLKHEISAVRHTDDHTRAELSRIITLLQDDCSSPSPVTHSTPQPTSALKSHHSNPTPVDHVMDHIEETVPNGFLSYARSLEKPIITTHAESPEFARLRSDISNANTTYINPASHRTGEKLNGGQNPHTVNEPPRTEPPKHNLSRPESPISTRQCSCDGESNISNATSEQCILDMTANTANTTSEPALARKEPVPDVRASFSSPHTCDPLGNSSSHVGANAVWKRSWNALVQEIAKSPSGKPDCNGNSEAHVSNETNGEGRGNEAESEKSDIYLPLCEQGADFVSGKKEMKNVEAIDRSNRPASRYVSFLATYGVRMNLCDNSNFVSDGVNGRPIPSSAAGIYMRKKNIRFVGKMVMGNAFVEENGDWMCCTSFKYPDGTRWPYVPVCVLLRYKTGSGRTTFPSKGRVKLSMSRRIYERLIDMVVGVHEKACGTGSLFHQDILHDSERTWLFATIHPDSIVDCSKMAGWTKEQSINEAFTMAKSDLHGIAFVSIIIDKRGNESRACLDFGFHGMTLSGFKGE